MSLNDTQIGWLVPAFMLVYMVAAPLFGAWGDRGARTRPIAIGVFLWSLATALSGLAHDYPQLLAGRALVGIGEAACVAIAPALLADCFAVARRGRVLAIFNMAIPVGSALGYVLGGLIGHHFGWRAAFFVAGAPGMLLAFAVLGLADPPRGAQEPAAAAERPAAMSPVAVYLGLLRRTPYMLVVLGYAAYTFALGGLALWMPTFLERVRGVSPDAATTGLRRHPAGDRFRRHVRRRLARGLPAALLAAGVPVVHRRCHAGRGAAGAAGTHRATPGGLLSGDRRRRAAAVHVHRPRQRTDRQHRLALGARFGGGAQHVLHPPAGRRALAGAHRLPVRSRLTRRRGDGGAGRHRRRCARVARGGARRCRRGTAGA